MKWNELTEEILVPSDVASAIFTGRPALLAGRERALTAEECKGIYHALGVMIETNHQLQTHARKLAKKCEMVRQAFNGLSNSINRLEGFANGELDEDGKEIE